MSISGVSSLTAMPLGAVLLAHNNTGAIATVCHGWVNMRVGVQPARGRRLFVLTALPPRGSLDQRPQLMALMRHHMMGVYVNGRGYQHVPAQ